MLEKSAFKKQLENFTEFPENQTYLLAVSGGSDSMVLAFLFQGLGLKFQVAHINYKLRGRESDSDQKVVEDFCSEHDIRFHLYEVSEKDSKPEHSIQLWARELRYEFFKQIQEKENLEFLVTAHHLNDQLETFIINLSKASGIKGLRGIPANDNKILRPLLHFSKDEIYDFANKNQIEYREDLSNKKSDYLRNKIRNEVVPKLLETNDHFLENFKKSLSYLNQTKDFVQQQIEEIENRITISSTENKILDKEKLNLESDFVKFEILKKYGFDKEEEIKKIFKSETGSSFYSKDFQLIINRSELIFISSNQWINTNEIILIEKSDISENQTIINLENTIATIEGINKTFNWDFDAEKITFPLKLRRKEEGDVFYPSGFSGKKKVSKFFKDEKLSILAKQKIWLLADGNNTVLGIIPFRQDKRYAKDEKTKNILTIFNEK
ncbi:tRNA lysidine(34) synthetase TilS [Chryseobacterium chendengshani]|uniref:tRNA lysidine(34) synthetase TilS n=1 Tax=Chryseobacterium sp. LJ668 TaxID=2864040 RepID=UPI001C691F91|nr:tRNA lysidine(34) synthetase TilS [Chryseobacterium sp. LJ668]MBW8524734.1 tRNA lysidine(34) synthetase TilS [Chryseobacterium sp. LJ668]QYK15133.1 tRNA lysidine(34) synthetase TilS [Chryseobacterium sp. LJ668]